MHISAFHASWLSAPHVSSCSVSLLVGGPVQDVAPFQLFLTIVLYVGEHEITIVGVLPSGGMRQVLSGWNCHEDNEVNAVKEVSDVLQAARVGETTVTTPFPNEPKGSEFLDVTHMSC